MFPELASPKIPIAIRTDHIVDCDTTLRVRQHGKGLSSAKFTIYRADGDKGPEEEIISADGKYMSRNEKRTFCDASGLPLFDVSHGKWGVVWHIQLPGSQGADPIGRVMPRFSMLRDKLDVEVKNAADNGELVTLRVQGQDDYKQRTNVYLGDKVVMTAKRTEKMAVYLPGRKMEWRVDIAAGMDASLASVIVVVMAANMYDSMMQSISS